MNEKTDAASPARSPTFATDHLANERTYLAWIRTSLAVIGLGFAVAKVGTWLRELGGQPSHVAVAQRSPWSLTVGLLMIGTGGAFAALAAFRHRAVSRQIEQGRVHSADAMVAVVTMVILAMALGVGLVTFGSPPE